MRLLAFVLRLYSFVFHLSAGAFFLGLAAIAAFRRLPLGIGFMPFDNERLLGKTALLGALGICCCLLALTRTFRFVFLLWTAVFVYLLLNSFANGAFDFEAPAVIHGLRWYTVGACAAFLGAGWSMKMRRYSHFLSV